MSAEEMEQPAKRWEVAAVTSVQMTQNKQLNTIELKVDKILNTQVTHQYVDEKVQVLKDRYDPVVDNVKFLTRALIVGVIGLIANIAVQLWSK